MPGCDELTPVIVALPLVGSNETGCPLIVAVVITFTGVLGVPAGTVANDVPGVTVGFTVALLLAQWLAGAHAAPGAGATGTTISPPPPTEA